MNEKQMSIYLNSLNFGLKDLQNTQNKYKNYKSEKFKEFIGDCKNNIENYFIWLNDDIKQSLDVSFNRYELDKKSHIRQFKTLINGITFDLNKSFIGRLEDLNDNETKNFTILFYINYYKKINEIMKEVLSEYVQEYPKKAIVEKLTN